MKPDPQLQPSTDRTSKSINLHDCFRSFNSLLHLYLAMIYLFNDDLIFIQGHLISKGYSLNRVPTKDKATIYTKVTKHTAGRKMK